MGVLAKRQRRVLGGQETFGSWGLAQGSDPEACDSTFHSFPRWPHWLLLFLRHTKPGPASGPFHSPRDTAPHIPAQLSLPSYLGPTAPPSLRSP